MNKGLADRHREGTLVIDSGTSGIVLSAVDLAATRALAALERQASALERVQARIQDVITLAPTAAINDWRGPAQRVYEVGLVDLRIAITAASLAIDGALAETRRATTTLASRVG